MGKKRKNKDNLEKLVAIIFFLIVVVLAVKTPATEIIDNSIINNATSNQISISNFFNNVGTNIVKENKKIIEDTSENIIIDNSKLNIIFFNVGQADCQLIIDDGKTMLIDSGNSKDGETIVNGLRALGIKKIDYLVGTHIHEDHIGGMSYIVNSFDIGKILLPYNDTSTANYYKKLLLAISNKGLNIDEINIGDKFKLGKGEFEIMSVKNNQPENANIASIVLQLSYGNLKYLFMGDAETENEKERNWEDIDVLKVGHHGSNTSSSEKFLSQVLPEVSIISVGKNNSYNLPKEKIINRLNKIGSLIYRTDLDGTIHIISDGNENVVKKINLSFDGNE